MAGKRGGEEAAGGEELQAPPPHRWLHRLGMILHEAGGGKEQSDSAELISASRDLSPSVRWAALKGLSRTGQESLPVLKNALGDRAPCVSITAARLLFAMGPGHVLDCFQKGDRWIRSAVQCALAQVGTPQAIEILLQTIRNGLFVSWETISRSLKSIEAEGLKLLYQGCCDLNPFVREVCCAALGERGEIEHRPVLERMVGDPVPAVRRRAAQGLLRLGALPAVHLVWHLESPNQEVRERACRGLREIGDARAVGPFLCSLHDSSSEVRFHAADCLGKIAGPEAVQPLLWCLRNDSDRWVRGASAWAVGRIAARHPEGCDNTKIAAALVEALSSDTWEVSWAAAWALGRLGDERAVIPLGETLKQQFRRYGRSLWSVSMALRRFGAKAVHVLSEALASRDWRVRWIAAETLGELGSPEAAAPLVRALHESEGVFSRVYAEALLGLGAPGIDFLMEIASQGPAALRSTVLWALGKSGDRRVFDRIAARLADPDSEVRQAAVWALADLHDKRAIEPFCAVLLHEAGDPFLPSVKESAARALAAFGEDALEGLNAAYQRGDPYTRELAVRALGTIGGPKVQGVLKKALGDSAPAVRASAAEALGNAGAAEAVEDLKAGFFDPEPVVRAAAIESIAIIGDPTAVPQVVRMLEDPQPMVREQACETLGRLGDAQAARFLATACSDPEPHVRRAAVEALGLLGSEKAVPVLGKALEDPEAFVRRVAAEALLAMASSGIAELERVSRAADAAVRLNAVHALGRHEGERATKALLERCRDVAYEVRAACAEALRGRRGKEVVEALKLLSRDAASQVRRNAVRALGHAGEIGVVEVVLPRFSDPAPEVRLAAVQAAARLGCFEPVMGAVSDPAPSVRAAALKALGGTRDLRYLGLIWAGRQDPEPAVREAAVAALGELGTVDPLVGALSDPDLGVRERAVEALGAVGDARAAEAILASFTRLYTGGREAACEALGRMGDQRALVWLLEALRDPDQGVRRGAAEALGRLGDERAVEPLLEMLRKTEEEEDERRIIEALARIGDKRAAPSILSLLELAPESFEEELAAHAARLGEAVSEPIVAWTRESAPYLRRKAALVLGYLQDARLFPLLLRLSRDHIPEVRCAAARALGRWSGTEAQQALVDLVSDSSEKVAEAAACALCASGPEDEKRFMKLLRDLYRRP